jgi:zinc protease
VRTTAGLIAGALLAYGVAIAAEIPAHPKSLSYPTLSFSVPGHESMRVKLKTGQVVYVGEDRTLPLARVTLLVRVGSWLDPADKPGLASLSGQMMRQGGTTRLDAASFDEEVDFLAAELGASAGDSQGQASVDCLSKDLDRCLDLLFEMVSTPRFQQDRLDVQKGKILEALKQRNDDASDILDREWDWLLYGREHFSARQLTGSELDAITRDDLIAFHRTYWRPESMIVVASGDLDRAKLLSSLERRFAAWKPAGKPPTISWPPAAPKHAPPAGLFLVEKDIPQGKVRIGHRSASWGPKRANKDVFALQLMNDILGGGGFTSRITNRIRTDEGLAYSAGSRFGVGEFWPLDFYAAFQSKNETVALAAKIAIEEIERIRNSEVSASELETAKNALIDTFPQSFESRAEVAALFANDEYFGIPHDYWKNYRANVGAVTAADVQRVAKQYLSPEKLTILVVGKWSEIEPGDPGKRANMKLFYDGKSTTIPLRDPVSLK